MKPYRYYRDCVSWPRSDVDAPGGLKDMISQETGIARRTFLKHVDRLDLEDLERNLGYAKHPAQGLTMAGDYHVSYHRSKLHGKRAYYFKWSSIEHVFTSPDVNT